VVKVVHQRPCGNKRALYFGMEGVPMNLHFFSSVSFKYLSNCEGLCIEYGDTGLASMFAVMMIRILLL
jgi:hypothetical protein